MMLTNDAWALRMLLVAFAGHVGPISPIIGSAEHKL